MTRRLGPIPRLATLATIAIALAAAGPARAGNAPSGGVAPSFFGVIPIQQMTEDEFQRMGAAQVGTLRLAVIWRFIEPSQDDGYDWSRLDYEVAQAAANGIQVLPYVYSTPQWAVTGCSSADKCQNVPPTQSEQSKDAWRDFLRDLVGRYGPNGEFWAQNPGLPKMPFTDYQAWNEPSSPNYWKKPNAGEYADLVRITHDAIVAEDPSARILLAGLFGTPQGKDAKKNVMHKYLGRFYDVPGISDSFDAVALHPYAPDVKELRSQIERARRIMAQNGDAAKELVVTEIGWGSAKPKGDRPLIKGKKGQAKLLRKSYDYLLDNRSQHNIGGVIWFAWRDPGIDVASCEFCGSAGLFKFNGKPKPAWDALVKITGGTP